jgi:hydrogenase maturation protease
VIRVIGIGSPLGDDAVGLAVARRLAADVPPIADVVAADRPGIDLVELITGATAAVLIDAVSSGSAPGTLHDVALADLAATVGSSLSSHDVSVREALALAAALGRLPPRGRLLGVEIDPSRAKDDRLSAAVDDAIAAASDRARLWVARYRSAAGG